MTPPTPPSPKSTGKFKLNLDGALCARPGCGKRRDEHATHDGGSHRWECPESGCPEFVAGGPVRMTEEELRADTEREMRAVRVSEAPPTDRDDKKD